MSQTLEYTERLEVVSCWCGIQMAAPTNLVRRWREGEQRDLYCPLGHSFVIRESDADRLRAKLASEERRRQEAERRANADRDLRAEVERQLRAQKAATTRARRRHAAALCPCCGRSFVQLRRHMTAKHPDFRPETGV